jgi:glycerophosphoryl diester phosphodiesterase
VPLLTEALELICAGGNVALIEQKSGDAATLVRLLRERELINRVVLISFDWEFLRRFNKLEPGQVLGALGPPARLADGRKPARLSRQPVTRRLDELDATGASLVVWNRRISNAEIRAAGQHRLKAWVYTINSAGPARRVLEAGAQGIITNKVVAIQAALARK